MSLVRGRRRLLRGFRARRRVRRRRLGLLTRLVRRLGRRRLLRNRLCLRGLGLRGLPLPRFGLRRCRGPVSSLVTAVVWRWRPWRRTVSRVVRGGWRRSRLAPWRRHVGDSVAQRRRRSREPTDGCVRIRGMLRARRHALRCASGEQREDQSLHDDFDISHVPAEKCCASMRSSP